MRRRHVLQAQAVPFALYGQNGSSLGQSLEHSTGRRLFGLFFIVALLALLGVEATSLADCGNPVFYYLTRNPANTITVCPSNSAGRACPDGGGMLRESEATGDVVRLNDDCAPHDTGIGIVECYVDECVPPGVYRYGFAVPYDCSVYSCWTNYYDTMSVTSPVEGCSRLEGTTPPEPYGAPPPWQGLGQRVCTYTPTDWGTPEPVDAGTDPGPVDAGWDHGSVDASGDIPADTPPQDGVDEEDASPGDPDAETTGCGCSIPAGGACAALCLDAAALLLGLAFLFVRRK